MQIEWVEIGKLKPNPKNPNKHSDEQIKRLAEIIKYQGWRHPIIVDKDYVIWAGHGRLEAGIQLGLQKVPVSVQEFLSPEQAYAFLVSDNSIASWAELDLSAVNLEIPSLGPDFEINLLGIRWFTVDSSEKINAQQEWQDISDFRDYPELFKLIISMPNKNKAQEIVEKLGVNVSKRGANFWSVLMPANE